MRPLLLFCLFVVIAGCSKENTELHGDITVSGKITDIVSGAPVPYAHVALYQVFERYNGIGYSPTVTSIAIEDTADSLGNYSMSVVANGEYAFEFSAEPQSPYYVSSGYTVGQNHQQVKSVGSHILNQPCHRSAYAKITLTNAAPVDTPYFITLTCVDDIVLHNFSKDTLVYLKLAGRSEIQNDIRFNKNNQVDQHFKITAGPWDTIPMQFSY